VTYLAVEATQAQSPWSWAPLGRVATLRREPNADGTSELLALSSERGVQPRPQDGGRQLPSADTITAYWRVKPGDVVFNPMWAIEGGVAVSNIAGAVSTAYRVYKPHREMWPRFLHYWLRSEVALDQYRLLVRGITTFDRSITREDLDAMPVPVPPLAAQRAIADYLDRETARIDALTMAKRQIAVRLTERWNAALDSAIWHPSARRVALRRVTQFVDYRGATPTKDDSGIPLITASHIRDGVIDYAVDPQFISEIQYGDWMRRGFPEARDVVMTTEAPLGEVAQIDNPRIALAQRVILLKATKGKLLPDFLALALRSPTFQAQLRAHATGSTALGIKADRLKTLAIPLPAAEDQSIVVSAMAVLDTIRARTAAALDRQVALLRERRNVLATGAVTGSLEVPSAA
jgi:type I restriction enzyme S subunit